MSQNKNNFPKEKSNRIVLFADLRDSTEILMNFDQEIYQKGRGQSEPGSTYEEFILDVHETSYKELYLGHENTYAEIYGDGVMGVFPEDNAKYILENIYRLTGRMRKYTLCTTRWTSAITLWEAASTKRRGSRRSQACTMPGF
jgi:hypothetical protein